MLIDTTSADFDSLFSVDGDNFISIANEQDFDLGDLNDAIPEVNVDPTSFNSTVGEIELTNFSSSGGDLGSANIEEVTGNDPNIVPTCFPVPAGDNSADPVRLNIGEETDFFTSATIKDGALALQITNNLGFDFRTTEISIIDTVSNTVIGSSAVFSAANNNQLTDGTTQTASVAFNNGDQLLNLGVEIVIYWDTFNFPANPQELTVNSVSGVGLVASQVQAVVEPQSFTTNSITDFDDSEFIFNDASHYVELESGVLQIDQIINSIDITVEQMVISFPGIRSAPYAAADSLVIEYSGASEIIRNGIAPARQVDLSGYRIYANNNQVEYNIVAQTENTQTGAGAQPRVINENDQVSSSVAISNLVVGEAFGLIVPQTVLLSNDDPNNGTDQLDVFNDNEAEISEIDGLSDLSSKLEGLEFTEPALSINYTTTVGVPTTIYGALLGVSGDGTPVYLSGKAGSEYEVTAPVNGLRENGTDIPMENLIKFDIDPATNSGSITFDENTTNVDDFLNNLPSEIRFIGKAVVNENNVEGSVTTPIGFDPEISVSIPLAFQTTQAATFNDTTDQDLGDLPSPDNGDDRTITEGKLAINYDNGLPMNVDLEINFLDSLYNAFETLTIDPLEAAGVDVNGFVDNPASGRTLMIALTESQLRQLYKTRYIEISAGLLSTDTTGDGSGNEVKIRTTDFITISVNADFTIESEVN